MRKSANSVLSLAVALLSCAAIMCMSSCKTAMADDIRGTWTRISQGGLVNYSFGDGGSGKRDTPEGNIYFEYEVVYDLGDYSRILFTFQSGNSRYKIEGTVSLKNDTLSLRSPYRGGADNGLYVRLRSR